MKSSIKEDLIKLLVLFSAYLIFGTIGLRIQAVSGFATLLWIPTGLSLAFILINGYRFLPAILLAAYAVNIINGAHEETAALIAMGNGLEALVGTYLLRRFSFKITLDEITDIFKLIFFGAIGSTLLSATIGVFALYFFEGLNSLFVQTWATWWTGDILSNLVIAPLFLSWAIRPNIKSEPRHLTEVTVSMIILTLLSFYVFGSSFINEAEYPVGAYVIFPILTWIAVRFDQKVISTAIFILYLVASWETILGKGPFFLSGSINVSLLSLEIFLGIIAGTFLILSASITRLRKLEKIKDDFFQIATHELKTPLTSIKAYNEIVHQRLAVRKDKKNTFLLGKMQVQIERLSKLINDLLDIARIQEGKLKYEISYFDFNELIIRTVDDIKTFSDKNISTKLDKTAILYGDSNRISQVITNLIDNASKYSPKSSKIIVRTRLQKNKVILGVKDYGLGIAKENLDKIFDKHFREEKSSTYAGLGIGLFISREIVKRHKGEIWVKSRVGKGSTFYISLPIRKNL